MPKGTFASCFEMKSYLASLLICRFESQPYVEQGEGCMTNSPPSG